MDILRTHIVALVAAATFALALASAACGGDSAAEGPPAAVVDTVHVRAADVPSTVQAIGTGVTKEGERVTAPTLSSEAGSPPNR